MQVNNANNIQRPEYIHPYRIVEESLPEPLLSHKPKNLEKYNIQEKFKDAILNALGEETDKSKQDTIKENTLKVIISDPGITKTYEQIYENKSKFYVVKGENSKVLDTDPEKAKNISKHTDEVINDFMKYSTKKMPTKVFIVVNEKKAESIAFFVEAKDFKGNFQYIAGDSIEYQGKKIRALDNKDILSHELGHKILADLNPKITEKMGSENQKEAIQARELHEGFADSVAFLSQASEKQNIKKIAKREIDLSKTNEISTIGENSDYLQKTQGEDYIKNGSLRDLSKIQKYNPDEKNPYKNGLSLSGTIYSSWASYIDHLESKGIPREEAVKKANETFKEILVKAGENENSTSIPTFVKALYDNTKDPELKKIIQEKANERNIQF